MSQFPAFPEAFGQLRLQARQGLNSPMGTDGLSLFYDPRQLCTCFEHDSKQLRETFLHLHLHCLFGHLLQGYDQESELWDEACDLAAGILTAKMLHQSNFSELSQITWNSLSQGKPEISSNQEFTSEKPKISGNRMLTSEKPESGDNPELIPDPRSLLPALQNSPELRKLARDCARDTHEFWFRAPAEPQADKALASGHTSPGSHRTTQTLSHLEEIHKLWSIPAVKIEKELSQRSGKRGHSSGKGMEKASLEQKDSIDYHQFLRRFTISREEAILDTDSFDYIPYYFGLTAYRNMPFIEPLEYQEVNRLDELAIAIDTSGSCSGRIVRRFLEETWNILRQRENFFSRMRLHLIQCDSVIQEHRIFTSVKEWEAALPDFQIHGFGDTDFCPVFDLLDELIAKKDIRHLRGLLYFTDGDGIFPRSRPSYETAFVFLNHELEKHEIPDWGIRLNLNLPEDF